MQHVYVEYRDGIVGNGSRIALFFYDPKDPASVSLEAAIKAVKMSRGLGIDIYRVMFDPDSVLSKAYDVVRAHTIVVIDGSGSFVQSLSAATNEQLEQLE